MVTGHEAVSVETACWHGGVVIAVDFANGSAWSASSWGVLCSPSTLLWSHVTWPLLLVFLDRQARRHIACQVGLSPSGSATSAFAAPAFGRHCTGEKSLLSSAVSDLLL